MHLFSAAHTFSKKTAFPLLAASAILIGTISSTNVLADENAIRTQKVSDSIYILHGKGGNIGAVSYTHLTLPTTPYV